MTVQELFGQITFDDMWAQMMKFYPDQEKNLEGYEYVFDYINTCEPKENEEQFIIHVEYVTFNDSWYEVYGTRPDNGEDYGMETYDMTFCTFEEWAGFDIDEELLETMPLEEIACHVIYEMTWNGFDNEQIKEKEILLTERYKEALRSMSEG